MVNTNDYIDSTCAVYSSYEPSNKLFHSVLVILEQVDKVFIVDDGSKSKRSLGVLSDCNGLANVEVIKKNINSGIAHSLNLGMQRARSFGYNWVITMDQDSMPDSSLLYEQHGSLTRKACDRIAIVAPRVVDEIFFDKKSKVLVKSNGFVFSVIPMLDRDDLFTAITSGALTNLEAVEHVGWFNELLFIDYVDTDLCLKLIRNKYKILHSHRSIIYHNLGEPTCTRFLGFTLYTFNHSSFRRYYISRNSFYMYSTYWRLFPSWVCYDSLVQIYIFIRVLFLEDKKKEKIKLSLKGYKDWFMGKMGKMSE